MNAERSVPHEASQAPTRPARVTVQLLLERLAAHPEELAALFERSDQALIAFDEDRNIVAANPWAERLFGGTPGGLRGRKTDDLVPQRLRQPQAPRQVPSADIVRVELPALLADGTELAVEWTYGSVQLPTRWLFVLNVRDLTQEERALESLRGSEERFRLLVDGIREYSIFMLDAEGRVSTWNKSAERAKGWSVEEAVGKPLAFFFGPEDRATGLPEQVLAAAARDGSKEVIGWRQRKDGTRFRGSLLLTALRSPAGELLGFATITRDLTEKLQADELAQRLVVERAAREAAEAAEQRARASEEQLLRLQRVTAALSEAASPQDVATVVLEQSLDAFGASGGAIYVLSRDRASLELLAQRGHPSEALMPFHTLPLELASPLTDAARLHTASFFESLEACASKYPELRGPIGSGGFEASAALPLATQGVLLGVLGVRYAEARAFEPQLKSLLLTLAELCTQALERARLFAAEKAARASAEAANRAKDEFLAMLGHELRNPLAPIVTALGMMERRDGSAGRRDREMIGRQVKHLTRLVDDLLDVSRITQGKVDLKKERLELAAVVGRAVELASPLLEQRHHYLSLKVEPQGLPVFGDPVRLAQVISNLLTNSAKYTPPGGHIEVIGAREGERIRLEVRDDGAGISAEMLPRVFDLFAQETQSIDRTQGGLGLGLALVKSLVTLHDGTVHGASDGHQKGATFTITLPAASPPTAAAASGTAAAPRLGGNGRRVLVVDDNVDAAELLAETVQELGYEVKLALDGPAALKLAQHFRPELAVLDIGLPLMDGYELARKLREELGAVHLVALTGYGQAADFQRTREAGFDVHLVKPVEFEALRAALEVGPARPAGGSEGSPRAAEPRP